MFGHEGPVQVNDQGCAVGPCIVAKNEGPNMWSTKLMGSEWHEFKLYSFGKPNPDVMQDFGWIPAKAVRQATLEAEVGIVGA
jgi:hypothetical protein